MAKKILIIQGHPDSRSFNHALHMSYRQGALESHAEVKEIFVSEMSFNPNLSFGYRERTELEPCLIEAQEKIKWSEHIVVFYPVWWGSVPAILKGFFDRVFLPGFAFKKRENSLWWDKLLVGRTAHIIATMDQPPWFYAFFNHAPSTHAIKRLTFEFCGIRPVKTTSIGPIRLSSDKFRQKWLNKIKEMGRKQN